jgi:hypothetical protein
LNRQQVRITREFRLVTPSSARLPGGRATGRHHK